MDRLKIALLTDMCGPVFGGGYQSTLWEVARRLGRHHEVRVFTSLPEARAAWEGVQFVRSFPMGIYPDTTGSRGPVQAALFAPMSMRDPLGSFEPDVLVVEAMPLLQLPAMRGWVRRHPGLKLLNVDEAWVGYSPFRGAGSALSLRLARWLLAQGLEWADTALAVSEATAEALRGSYGAPDVLLFPSGLDVPRLQAQLPKIPVERDLDVISVGRLVPIKRLGDLVRALAILRERHGWAGRATFVGEGVCGPELREQARRLGLAGQLELTGRIPERQKMELLSRSKLFVLPSEREGFSLATLEAMLAGCLPVVAVPPHPEVFGVGGLVHEGRTGRRFPLGDVEGLARILAQTLQDEPARSRMAEQARSSVPFYDWDALIERFEPELQKRVSHAPRGA